jgi:tetratricopeptide (TPR) repeat protein
MRMDSLEARAELAEEAGELENALDLWGELAAREREPDYYCRYGLVAERLERWDEAEKAYSEALRLEPDNSAAMQAMGDLWARRSDKEESESFAVAKDWFLRALKHERTARVLTFLGSTYAALDDLERARASFEEAISLDPVYSEALYNLAALEEKANPQRATGLLIRAVDVDPEYSLAHQLLGRIYHRGKDPARAEYHYRRSLEADPADYWSNIFLANFLGAQGRDEEAERIYRFATDLHPEIEGGRKLFARFLGSIGKPEEAAKLLASRSPDPSPFDET